MNKKGQTGEAVINVYRVLLVTVITAAILVLSAVFYDYDISVRDSEALIFGRQIADCVVPNGVLNLGELGDIEEGIFSFCGFDESESERFFLSIAVSDSAKEIGKLVDGDEGLAWVQKIYASDFKTDSIEKYEPGYYNGVFSVRVLKEGAYGDAEMRMEVIVKDEF